MGRSPVLTACLVLCATGGAAAGGPSQGGQGSAQGNAKTSKVTIETDPPGAKVYFNVKEDGEVCTTPCTVDAPIGETPIIVEAENRRAIIENLVVPKKTARPIQVSYKLKPAYGSLVIEGSDGATIKIDEHAQGTAPRRFDEVLAGAHHVVLEKDGKKIYDEFVEVEIDTDTSVAAPRSAEPPPAPPPAPGVIATREPEDSAHRLPTVAVAAATDVGFRQFTYSNNRSTDQQHDETETGQVLTGATVDVWPTTLLHLGVLPGFALHGRFQIGVNPQRITQKNAMTGATTPTSLSTSWRSLEISARQRWTIASAWTLEVGAGYTDDRYQFSSDHPIPGEAPPPAVPDAAYKAVRIGGRASLLLGGLEPYISAENRLVLSGGALANRYTLGTSVNGVLAALGAVVHLGQFEIRGEASLAHYGWTFRPDMGDPQADGASDLIERLGLSVGYVY
ncbi:MAG TPA: PEGA domain-containing protein [Kofleriaceae bacterium]|nr:PEGA domain-containing protein [Kofleriaceae bacterium]